MFAVISQSVWEILSPIHILLLASVLLFLSILAGKAGYKIGIPVLLLFLAMGMVFGQDGLGIRFADARLAQFIGVMALSIILFSGGMDTKYKEIAPIWKEGVLLASLGVLITAFITGGFIFLISSLITNNEGFTFAESMLMASVMSSTDSASVFSLLRSKGINISRKLRSTLELESGSNDPMAFMLTIFFIGVVNNGEASLTNGLITFAIQMVSGGLLGYIMGRAMRFIINKINLDNAGLSSVLMLALVFFTFTFTDLVKGNGYLAVYVSGLVVGNTKFIHKRSIGTFFDGVAWLCQIVMFLTLGLLVNPTELLSVAGAGIAVGAFMIIFGRPISVFLCLLPFKRISMPERWYVSWVGLRGAVPIIFATYPMIQGVESANFIFNVVFFITIISLLVQGTSLAFVADKLKLSKAIENDTSEFGVELSEDIKSTMSEVLISETMLEKGNRLMDMIFPENTLVVMVKRDGNYFVPQGKTELSSGDKVLLISDSPEELRKIYEKYGVEHQIVGRE